MSGLFGNPLRVFVLPTSLGVSVILRITLSALAVSLRVSNLSQAASYTSTAGSFSSLPKAAGHSVHALQHWGDPAFLVLRLHDGTGRQEALHHVAVAAPGRPVQRSFTSDSPRTTPPGFPFPGKGKVFNTGAHSGGSLDVLFHCQSPTLRRLDGLSLSSTFTPKILFSLSANAESILLPKQIPKNTSSLESRFRGRLKREDLSPHLMIYARVVKDTKPLLLRTIWSLDATKIQVLPVPMNFLIL